MGPYLIHAGGFVQHLIIASVISFVYHLSMMPWLKLFFSDTQ